MHWNRGSANFHNFKSYFHVICGPKRAPVMSESICAKIITLSSFNLITQQKKKKNIRLKRQAKIREKITISFWKIDQNRQSVKIRLVG